MTQKDEEDFSILLRLHISEIKFISKYVWETPVPPIHDLINQCQLPNGRRPSIVLLNEAILPMSGYEKYIRKHLSGVGYVGPSTGDGMIQFVPSEYSYYVDNCLGFGILSSSYNPEKEPETGKYINRVWKLFKSKAIRVYQINRNTGEVSSKPDSGLYAWPDAASKFNCKDNHFLTASALDFFIPETCITR